MKARMAAFILQGGDFIRRYGTRIEVALRLRASGSHHESMLGFILHALCFITPVSYKVCGMRGKIIFKNNS